MIEIGLGHYLSLGAIIFFLGVMGIFLNRKNVIVILMSIELILLAINLNFSIFSVFIDDIVGELEMNIHKGNTAKVIKSLRGKG